ncbi:MAG: hypothetical protein QMC80_07540 [Thermoplasmatales archaeon]|nr:hypothetical protein [Thermoplasmatales archaeon]
MVTSFIGFSLGFIAVIFLITRYSFHGFTTGMIFVILCGYSYILLALVYDSSFLFQYGYPTLTFGILSICLVLYVKKLNKNQLRINSRKFITYSVVFVLLISLLGSIYYLSRIGSFHPQHAEINLNCNLCDAGYVVTIQSASRAFVVSALSYKIEYEEEGSIKVAANGTVNSVYQYDFNFLKEDNSPANDICFIDLELDQKITAGDYFLIRKSVGKPDFIFRLVSSSPHYDIDASIVLSENAPIASQNVTASNPNNKFTTVSLGDNPNVTISNNHPAFSAYPCLDDEPLLIGVTIENSNITLNHVLVEFYENDSYIGSVSKPVINPNSEARFTIEYSFDDDDEYNIVTKAFIFGWSKPIIANATAKCILEIPPPV